MLRNFDAPLTNTPRPLLTIQTNARKTIAFNLALDPHEDFGIDSLRASIATEQTASDCCEQKECQC